MMTFSDVKCASCGVRFGMDPFLDAQRKEDGQGFYCTNGHRLTYGDSELDKARRERDRLRQENARLEEEASAASAQAERARAESKRLKRRAAAGMCPICKRAFPELSRHLHHKHPEFVEENIAKRGRPKKDHLLLEGPQ